MPGKKVNDHKENEAKKSSYSKGLKVNRGKTDYAGADKEEIEAWNSLNFKDFQKVDATINGATGFYIKNACGEHIFSALTEVLAS